MKSLKFAMATTIAMLIATAAMAAEESKSKAKDKGPALSPIARTMLRIDRIKSAVEGLDRCLAVELQFKPCLAGALHCQLERQLNLFLGARVGRECGQLLTWLSFGLRRRPLIPACPHLSFDDQSFDRPPLLQAASGSNISFYDLGSGKAVWSSLSICCFGNGTGKRNRQSKEENLMHHQSTLSQ